MRSLSTTAWACDVETHTGHMNNQLHHLLHRVCAVSKGTPKRPYVSEVAWTMRRQKLHHRKELKTARALMRRETLARVFAAWRAPSDHSLSCRLCSAPHSDVDFSSTTLASNALRWRCKGSLQVRRQDCSGTPWPLSVKELQHLRFNTN
jgi:hypothetical protein